MLYNSAPIILLYNTALVQNCLQMNSLRSPQHWTAVQCFIKLVLKSICLPLLRPTNNKLCTAKLVSIRFNCSEFWSRPENVTSRFHTYNALQCRRFLLMCILWPDVLHSALWNLKNFLLMFILLLVYCTLCWMDDLGQLALMSGGHWPEPPLTLWSLPRKCSTAATLCSLKTISTVSKVWNRNWPSPTAVFAS